MLNRGPDACRSCDAPILWARTVTGKSIPLNYEPDPEGNIVLEQPGARRDENRAVTLGKGTLELAAAQADPTVELFMPHHATCPQGAEWRRR